MSHQSLTGLGCGERAPDFVAPVEDGTETRFYARAGGRPALLLFTSSGSHAVFRVAMALADRASLHLVVPEGRLSAEDLRTSENQFLKTQDLTAPASALDDTDLFQDDGVVREASCGEVDWGFAGDYVIAMHKILHNFVHKAQFSSIQNAFES